MRTKTIDPRWAIAALAMLAACDRAPAPQPKADAPAAPSPSPAPLPTPDPVFTSLGRSSCTLIEARREEAGYARFLCAGRGDHRLEVIEADAREDLAVRGPGEARQQLQLPSTIANGAFSTLGETVEWIGGNRLIVRYEIFDPDGRTAAPHLLVVDLAADPICVTAKVPPATDQNARARRVAEAAIQPACINRG